MSVWTDGVVRPEYSKGQGSCSSAKKNYWQCSDLGVPRQTEKSPPADRWGCLASMWFSSSSWNSRNTTWSIDKKSIYCSKNNLSLRTKTEPVTAGADGKAWVWFLCQINVQISLIRSRPWKTGGVYVDSLIIFGAVYIKNILFPNLASNFGLHQLLTTPI